MHWEDFRTQLKRYDPECDIEWNTKGKQWVIFKWVWRKRPLTGITRIKDGAYSVSFGTMRKSIIVTLSPGRLEASVITGFRRNDPRRFSRIDGKDWEDFILSGEREGEIERNRNAQADVAAMVAETKPNLRGRIQVSNPGMRK